MKRVAVVAVLLGLFLCAPALADTTMPTAAQIANAVTTPVDVSDTPLVQASLKLAWRFWGAEAPQLTTTCGSITTDVGPMVYPADAGNGGIIATGSSDGSAGAWAETQIGGCTITISAAMWGSALGTPARAADDEFAFAFAHEIGHVLGLPDMFGAYNNIMTGTVITMGDPVADLTYLGWERLTADERWWLCRHALEGRPSSRCSHSESNR